MRVLHLIKTPVGATWAFRLIERSQMLGVHNLVYMPVGNGEMKDRYRSIGVPVVHAPFLSGIPGFLRWAGGLRKIVDMERPDIVHSHFFITTMVARLAMIGTMQIPRVFQIPGPLHLEHLLPRTWDRISAGEKDHFIATCNRSMELLVHDMGISPARVHLSYYGTEIGMFSPMAKGILRNTVESGGKKIVGLVAWMYPPKRYLGHREGIKGHEVFLRAMPRVLREYPDCIGVVIGGQWGAGTSYENRLRRLGKSLCGDSVLFLGPRADVPDLYPEIDVAVHPSLSENVGGAVESLLCGVPTVASATGGLPDVVKDGETGLLFPPGDPETLAEKVLYMLKNPDEARRMSLSGRNMVLKMFNVERTAREVVDIYRAIAGEDAGFRPRAGEIC